MNPIQLFAVFVFVCALVPVLLPLWAIDAVIRWI